MLVVVATRAILRDQDLAVRRLPEGPAQVVGQRHRFHLLLLVGRIRPTYRSPVKNRRGTSRIIRSMTLSGTPWARRSGRATVERKRYLVPSRGFISAPADTGAAA